MSPEGVAFLSTFSSLSAPMKRNCTGWLAHCVNSLVRPSSGAFVDGIELDPAQAPGRRGLGQRRRSSPPASACRMLPGRSSWPAAATPPAAAAGRRRMHAADGFGNARTTAAPSGRSGRRNRWRPFRSGPAGRWRGTGRTGVSQVSSWSMRAPCGAEHLHQAGLGARVVAIGEADRRLFQFRVVRELLHVDGEQLGRGKTRAGASRLRERAGAGHRRECDGGRLCAGAAARAAARTARQGKQRQEPAPLSRQRGDCSLGGATGSGADRELERRHRIGHRAPAAAGAVSSASVPAAAARSWCTRWAAAGRRGDAFERNVRRHRSSWR